MADQDDGMLQARLAEYASQRAEIGWRTQAQQTLLGLNVTAVGLVGSAALTATGRRHLLLVLPYICPALAMAWLDHGRSIANIAYYLRARCWPSIQEITGLTTPDERSRLWCRDEYTVAEGVEPALGYRMTIVVPYALAFTAPPVVALAFAVNLLDSIGLVLLWVAGLALTAGSAVWWGQFRPMTPGPATARATSSPGAP